MLIHQCEGKTLIWNQTPLRLESVCGEEAEISARKRWWGQSFVGFSGGVSRWSCSVQPSLHVFIPLMKLQLQRFTLTLKYTSQHCGSSITQRACCITHTALQECPWGFCGARTVWSDRCSCGPSRSLHQQTLLLLRLSCSSEIIRNSIKCLFAPRLRLFHSGWWDWTHNLPDSCL